MPLFNESLLPSLLSIIIPRFQQRPFVPIPTRNTDQTPSLEPERPRAASLTLKVPTTTW